MDGASLLCLRQFYRFNSMSPFFTQPSLRRPKSMIRESRAGRIKQINASPSQSIGVMAAFVPAAMSLTQPDRPQSALPNRMCPCRWK